MRRKHLVLAMGLLSLLSGGTGIAAAADPTQAVGQEASSNQSASSSATSTQQAPSNQNIDVRIFSPGDNGAVTQTNSSAAASAAANANATSQAATQSQPAGGGTQAVGQGASNTQSATSQATSTQVKPSNSNISVRIDSPGNNGAVEQTNSSSAQSAAGNANETTQSANQAQAGGACCAGTSGGTQAAGQVADNKQDATSEATSTQTMPSNSNISVRIDSPGNNGSVEQTNASQAASIAANGNSLDQTTKQQQAGGACCGSGGTQAAGQAAGNDQTATSSASSTQVKPSNSNTPVRIGSPGNDGDVTQTNISSAVSAAGNVNETAQSVDQQQAGSTCCKPSHPAPYSTESPKPCCGGSGLQAVEQVAWSEQNADSSATATQSGASNTNAPVRIGSPGNGGSVEQTNATLAASAAINKNELDQNANQTAGGAGTTVQAVGQFAGNDQTAESDATASQYKPSNDNSPVRIGSEGYDGSVEQTNVSAAGSIAANHNDTTQSTDQKASGDCKCSGTTVQAIGQKADSTQDADSSATATQSGASNTNAPVRIGSPGNGGSVEQTNATLAASAAINKNELDQNANQTAGGAGTTVQAIGQKAGNWQSAESDATATQYKPSNHNSPVRIKSKGDDGKVVQANLAAAESLALNVNDTTQSAEQKQSGDCRCAPKKDDRCCHSGTGIQAIGQFAYNRQDADSSADTKQIAPANHNAPVRIWSMGGGGSVEQLNAAHAGSLAANLNSLSQWAKQG